MAKGPLRTAIETALSESFKPEGGPGWWARVLERWAAFRERQVAWAKATPSIMAYRYPSIFLGGIAYALFGWDVVYNGLQDEMKIWAKPSLSEQIAAALGEVFSNPLIKEMAEIYGAAYTEPVLAVFESYAGKENVDPKEFARALHGLGIEFNIAGALGDALIESLTAGQVDFVGRLFQQLNFQNGLDYIGHRSIGPILDYGVMPGLEGYYKKLYRPTRFSAADLRDLYALGEISIEGVKEGARFNGWRDQDIDLWIRLAYKPLSQGEVFAAFNDDRISKDDATRRLRQLGYDPGDLPLLFDLNQPDKQTEEKSIAASTARQAFRDGLISAAELSAILKELKYGDKEITLILGIEAARQAGDKVSLSVAQIKGAWQENVLTDPEALYWLRTKGVNDNEAAILLETWKAELAPDFRKLNVGTITAAYVNGILSRDETLKKLTGVGLAPEDAELNVKLAEIRNPDAFGGTRAAASKKLAPGTLRDLLFIGLVTADQMQERLIQSGYTSQDAGLIVQAALYDKERLTQPLPQSILQRAYLAGVIDRAAFASGLVQLGFTDNQAAVIVDTVDAENPAALQGTPAERMKSLSPGNLHDLYIAGLIDRPTYVNRLGVLGFSGPDAELLAQAADKDRQSIPRGLSQGTIENAYLTGIFDRTTAANKLIDLGFTPEDAETVLQVVEARNPGAFLPGAVSSVRTPSINTLAAAVSAGILSVDDFLARAQDIGYSIEDASIYLSLATKTERKGTKSLSVSQITGAYGKGLMGRSEAMNRLYQSGYNDVDATLILRMEKDFIELSDVWNELMAGNIDPFDAIAQLVSSNYSDQDILEAFGSLSPETLGLMGLDLAALRETLAGIPGGA